MNGYPCEEIDVDVFKESAECSKYGPGPTRPTDLHRPKASLDRGGERKKTCEDCPQPGVVAEFLTTVLSNPFFWNFAKSVLLFAAGVKLAHDCMGLIVWKPCDPS